MIAPRTATLFCSSTRLANSGVRIEDAPQFTAKNPNIANEYSHTHRAGTGTVGSANATGPVNVGCTAMMEPKHKPVHMSRFDIVRG